MKHVSKFLFALLVACIVTSSLQACRLGEQPLDSGKGSSRKSCSQVAEYVGGPLSDVPLDKYHPSRVFQDGTQVLMDFDPVRTNIVYNDQNIVVRAYCG